MKKQTPFLLFMFIFYSCEDESHRESMDQWMDQEVIFYHNSFESRKDTLNWQGYSSLQFKAEAPDGGGKQSVFISGGCIVPHAYLDFGPMKEAGAYILRCWGENLSNGGFIELVSGDDDRNSIHIQIIHKEWNNYVSEDTLYCPAGGKLRLSMNAGGFLVSSMLVDMLEIVKVNSQ